MLDGYLSFVKDESEWKGTDIVFDVSEKEGKTEVRFMHIGLVPAYECYGDCSNAWGFYINGSLRSLITTGKGQPNQKGKRDGKRLLKLESSLPPRPSVRDDTLPNTS